VFGCLSDVQVVLSTFWAQTDNIKVLSSASSHDCSTKALAYEGVIPSCEDTVHLEVGIMPCIRPVEATSQHQPARRSMNLVRRTEYWLVATQNEVIMDMIPMDRSFAEQSASSTVKD
jgi:hypothetical protein